MIKLIKKEADIIIQSDEKSVLSSLTVSNMPISADYEDLPVLLGALRKFAGMTTQQLADGSGEYQANVSNFEHGKRAFNFSNLEKLMGGIGYKYSILIEKLEDVSVDDSISTEIVSETPISSFLPEELQYDFLSLLEKKTINT